ncbi:hypothetical protein LMG23994_06432 [Cupriavidus pinatubonensis]|uniref:Uncharacterized protein n=1 Tax=Cupriavidus pinatubonensis TaxID=248026 RepID=A0ABM8Y2P1_9BURK|nr:hypothetical protein LMG23994_06432 [Cupriavidus pinatubonensis]
MSQLGAMQARESQIHMTSKLGRGAFAPSFPNCNSIQSRSRMGCEKAHDTRFFPGGGYSRFAMPSRFATRKSINARTLVGICARVGA